MNEPLHLVPPPDPEQMAQSLLTRAEAILNFLNTKSGRRFPARTPKGQPTSALLLIVDRLRDGWPDADFRSVIAMKIRNIRTDKDRFYCRPETLFRKSNFEAALGELE